jgi:hypothetical protein
MTRRAAALLAVASALLLLALAATHAAEAVETLRVRCQEVRLQLAAEKARILREDAGAVALREQIERLYRDLDRLVSAKPTVARLQADLSRLEEALAGPAERAPPPRPAEGRAP